MAGHMKRSHKRKSRRRSRRTRKRSGGSAQKLKECMQKCKDDAAKVIQKAVRAKKMLSPIKPGSIKAKMAAYQKAAREVKKGAKNMAKDAQKTIRAQATYDKDGDSNKTGLRQFGGKRRRKSKRRRSRRRRR